MADEGLDLNPDSFHIDLDIDPLDELLDDARGVLLDEHLDVPVEPLDLAQEGGDQVNRNVIEDPGETNEVDEIFGKRYNYSQDIDKGIEPLYLDDTVNNECSSEILSPQMLIWAREWASEEVKQAHSPDGMERTLVSNSIQQYPRKLREQPEKLLHFTDGPEKDCSRGAAAANNAIEVALDANPQPQPAGTKYIIAIHQTTKDRKYFAGRLDEFERPAVEECFRCSGWKISSNRTCGQGMECYQITHEILRCGDVILSQNQHAKFGRLSDVVPDPSFSGSQQNSTYGNEAGVEGVQQEHTLDQNTSSSFPTQSLEDGLLSRFQKHSLETEPLGFGQSADAEYRKMSIAPPYLLENADAPHERYINIYARSKNDGGWERVPFEVNQAVLFFKAGVLKRAVIAKVGETNAKKPTHTGNYDIVVSNKRTKVCHEELFVRVTMEGWVNMASSESNKDKVLENMMAEAANGNQIAKDPNKGRYEKRSFAPPFFLLNIKPSYDKYLNAYAGDGSWEIKEFHTGNKAFWFTGRELKRVEIVEGLPKPRKGYCHVKVVGSSPRESVELAHDDLFVAAIVDGSSSSKQFWDADYKFGKGATGKVSPGNRKLRNLVEDNIDRYFKAENEPPPNQRRSAGVYKSDISKQIVDARRAEGAKFWYEVYTDEEYHYWAEEVNESLIQKRVAQMLRDKKGDYVMSKFLEVLGVAQGTREFFEHKIMGNSNKLRLFEQIGKNKKTKKVSSMLIKLFIFSKKYTENQEGCPPILSLVGDNEQTLIDSGVFDQIDYTKIASLFERLDDALRSQIYEEIHDKINAYVQNEFAVDIVVPSFKELLGLVTLKT